jgi:hypothetical protein
MSKKKLFPQSHMIFLSHFASFVPLVTVEMTQATEPRVKEAEREKGVKHFNKK